MSVRAASFDAFVAEFPLRILVHGINFAPEPTGIGKYTGEMVDWLSERGHSVRVVTAPPYYPQWRVQPGFKACQYQQFYRAGVHVWRCPLWVPSRVTAPKRLLHLASFALSAAPVMLREALWPPDVIVSVAPALMSAPLALITSRLCGAPSWLHIQDFEVNAAFDLGLLRSSVAKQVALTFERRLFERFDRVSTISTRMVDLLRNKGVGEQRQVLLPNWVDLRKIAPVSEDSFRRELTLAPDAIVALYSGNMGEKQGLECLAEAAHALVMHPRIVFVFCGDGAGRSRLQSATRGLNNVHWLPLQPTERLNSLLNLADIHLLPQRADVADLVMPSKLTGMLASARPVVATAARGTQIADVAEKTGIVVPPGNAQAFAAAIAALAADPQRRATLGRRARDYAVQHFDRQAILGRFEAELIALVRSRAHRARPKPQRAEGFRTVI